LGLEKLRKPRKRTRKKATPSVRQQKTCGKRVKNQAKTMVKNQPKERTKKSSEQAREAAEPRRPSNRDEPVVFVERARRGEQ